jgi:hypothetical protein
MTYVSNGLIYKSRQSVSDLTYTSLDAAQADGWAASKRDYPSRRQVGGLAPGEEHSGDVARLRRITAIYAPVSTQPED